MTEQGKKHQPLVKIVDDLMMIITIGRDISHPMEENHLIDSIDVLNVSKVGLLRVRHYDLKAGYEPKIEINLSNLKEGTYKVHRPARSHRVKSEHNFYCLNFVSEQVLNLSICLKICKIFSAFFSKV